MAVLAKPLADGSVALSFINLREEESVGEYAVTVERILAAIGEKLPNLTEWKNAKGYRVTDLWSGEVCDEQSGTFAVKCLAACDNVTVRVTPNV